MQMTANTPGQEQLAYLRGKPGVGMLSLNQIKFLRALSARKNRQKYHKFIAEGEKVVREALREWPDRVEAVYADRERYSRKAFHLPSTCTWFEAGAKDMERVTAMQTPPGILAEIRMPQSLSLPDQLPAWMLYLDGVADPGNLGGILRSADWFGLRQVVLGPGTAEWSNPKVVQASMGSVFRVELYQASLEQIQANHKALPLFAADLEGTPLGALEWPETGILVLGGESHGISEHVRRCQPTYIRIPGDPETRAESLNVHVAAGILLAQWYGGLK